MAVKGKYQSLSFLFLFSHTVLIVAKIQLSGKLISREGKSVSFQRLSAGWLTGPLSTDISLGGRLWTTLHPTGR